MNSVASPPIQKRPYRFSRDEFLRMSELGLFSGKRVVLIDGEILEMAAQKNRHAQGVQALVDALTKLFGANYWVRSQMALDLDPYGLPDPDLAVIRGGWRTHPPDDIPTDALLVAEVADSTLNDDRTWMMSLYAAAGIREYWILNLVDEQLEIHRQPVLDSTARFGSRYASITIHESGDQVASLELPQSRIAVSDLFV